MRVLAHSRRPEQTPVISAASGNEQQQVDRLPGDTCSSGRLGAIIEASDVDDTPIFPGEDLPVVGQLN
jgi:hypothetical protein